MDIKQGIIVESNKEYHDYKGAISKSQLAKMAICPKYFKWCEDNPQEKTEAQIMGSAFHKFTLEPETFGKEFVVMPTFDRRTKLGREAYDEFMKQTEGRDALTEAQFALIKDMAQAILSDSNAVEMTQGFVEQSFYGVDELTGEYIKVRPDCYYFDEENDRIVIADLKSCQSALSDDFTRDAVKYSYDLQAYMYRYVVSQVLNVPIEKVVFVFIAIEKKAPFMLNSFVASQDFLARGEALYRKYIGMYHEAKTTNNWWGLNGKHNLVNELTLPTYLRSDDNG